MVYYKLSTETMELYLDYVMFKLDVEVVVEKFNKPCLGLSYFGYIRRVFFLRIRYCISYLVYFCSNSLVKFTRRKGSYCCYGYSFFSGFLFDVYVSFD